MEELIGIVMEHLVVTVINLLSYIIQHLVLLILVDGV